MNRTFKGILGFVLSLAMVISFTLPAFGSAPEGAETTDIYSSWAGEDVFLAQSVYRLGNEGTYSNFKGALSGAKFAAVAESLELVFETDYEYSYGDGPLTRGQVISALFGLRYGGSPSEDEALEYFVENGLILGRKDGGYQLDEICTVEEMIIFASRVYDYGVYEADNYSTGFFWQAEGKSNTVYLLGSIHLSDNSIYPLNKSANIAFARSANLVVEADISDISVEESDRMLEMAFIDPESGFTIADFISEETFDLLAQVCEAMGLPPEYYLYMQPWMAINLVTLLIMMDGDAEQLESQAQMGIDMHYLFWAAETGKNIMQLESVLFQLELLSSSSYELQDLMLYETLMSVVEPSETDENEVADLFNILKQALKDGDDVLMALYLGIEEGDVDPMIAEYHKNMFYHRDVAMTEKIAGYLEETEYNGNYFIVVGAGHLVGDQSIVAQLTEKGYDVVRVRK